jgi:eukaryotic-like serine/threonine-protein kinase
VVCPQCSAVNPDGASACKTCNAILQTGEALPTEWISPEKAHAAAAGVTLISGDSPQPEGTVLGGRYRLIKRIGQGGMGAVYEAIDLELDRTVALKVIKPEYASEPAVVQRFKQELVLARAVTHRNVIRIFDIGLADGFRFITMEYVRGRDLAAILKDRGKLGADEAVSYMKQICDGLTAAHSEGVVHRDLKPTNIMVNEQGRALIMDFGIARSADSSTMTRTGATVGTPAYMSPEQAQAKPVDARSDIYSLGIIFYELLTGTVPFVSDAGMMAMLVARCKEKPAPPVDLDPTIPRELNDIVLKALATDPARRFASAREFRQALERYTPDPGSHPPPPRQRFRRPAEIAVVAVAAISLATAAYLVVSRTPGGSGAAPPRKAVTVLVADFDNTTAENIFDGTLEPVFSSLVEGASFVNVYNRTTAHDLVEQLKPGTSKLNESTARLIAAREGINVVLTGLIARQGDGYRVTVNAVDGVTGKTIVSRDSSTVPKERVLTEAARMVPGLRRAIGDSTPEAQQLAAGETFTSTSLDALHFYGAAQQQQWAGNFQAAIDLYLKAIQADPKFGRAYAGVAAMNRNLGRSAEAEKYFKLALEQTGLMTDREKLRTRGGYFLYLQDPQAIAEYSELVKLYPNDTAGQANLALAYCYAREWQKALVEGRKSVELEPKNVLRQSNLAFYALYGTDAAAAATDARVVLSRNPKYWKAYIVLALSQMLEGRPEDAAKTYRRLQGIDALGSSMALTGLADIDFSQGKFTDAASVLENGIAADSAAPDRDYAIAKIVALAEAELAQAKPAKAIENVNQALKLSKSYPTLFAAARVLLRMGQMEKARQLASDLDARPRPEPRAYGKLIAAEILMEQRKATEAIAALKEAQQLADTWTGHLDLGRAYLMANAPADADSELDVCIKRRGEATSLFLDDVPTHRYLPEVYYYKGRATQGLTGEHSPAAIDSFKKFLALKNASQRDPMVESARQQVGQPAAH